MGPKKACPNALIFCNKNINSTLTFSLGYNIEMCCYVIMNALSLSIDFSTLGSRFPFEVNHSPKEDLENLSNGLECSPSFL